MKGIIVVDVIVIKLYKLLLKAKNLEYENDNYEKFIMPSFIGMTITEAAEKCAEMGLQYLIQGEGDYVTNQIVAPGVEAQKNDIVLLVFE